LPEYAHVALDRCLTVVIRKRISNLTVNLNKAQNKLASKKDLEEAIAIICNYGLHTK
jgi:hypothetical protein